MRNKYKIEEFVMDLGCSCCEDVSYILKKNGEEIYSSNDYDDCLIGIINNENIDFTE